MSFFFEKLNDHVLIVKELKSSKAIFLMDKKLARQYAFFTRRSFNENGVSR